MRELNIQEVRVSTSGSSPVVVLQEAEGDRLLPIWMSAGGAAAIVSATEPVDPSRPCVHDLVADLLAALSGKLEQVRIVGYEDGQFYAELVVGGTVLPARPSDAIALALRSGCPILCADDVLEEAAVQLVPEVPAPPEDEVEKFREFLDSVNPDDF
ncbi:MAG: bifunctional nuclease family protein [Propionicimonas sp.]